MKKFILLFKKELKEMLIPQLWIPFFAVIIVFLIIGNVTNKQTQEQTNIKNDIAIADFDQSVLSNDAIKTISQFANIVSIQASDDLDFISQMQEKNIDIGLIIPKNFEKNILNSKKEKIKSYASINNFSVLAGKQLAILETSKKAINELVSDKLINTQLNIESIDNLKNPISNTDYILANNKIKQGNPNQVLNYLLSQTTSIPIVLFVVIVMASQMIAASVATEKENKTLETLLSLPISRKAIVVSKMLAAGLVSLMMAGIYMLAIKHFNSGISGVMSGINSNNNENIAQIIQDLGLKFSTVGLLELGIILFLAILLALAIAMILGSFSEDAKSAQGLVAPLMILVMIPYFITLFMDINTLSLPIRYIIYAIPFSHVFLAIPNILLGNHTFIILGAVYMLILFIVFVLIAAKIFSSDLILTMKLNFSKKKK